MSNCNIVHGSERQSSGFKMWLYFGFEKNSLIAKDLGKSQRNCSELGTSISGFDTHVHDNSPRFFSSALAGIPSHGCGEGTKAGLGGPCRQPGSRRPGKCASDVSTSHLCPTHGVRTCGNQPLPRTAGPDPVCPLQSWFRLLQSGSR